MSTPRVAHCKGAVLREFLVWYEARVGPAALEALVAQLSPEHRAVFMPGREALGVLASQWYPVAPLHELCDLLTRDLSTDEREQLVHEGTRAMITGTIRGVYRSLFTMLVTPTMYARHAQRAWNLLNDTGERSLTFVAPKRMASVVRHWDGHHPLLCAMASETVRVLLEELGCKDVVVTRVGCVAQGAPECTTMLAWK